MAGVTVDARGLKCPLPILKAHKALRALASGEAMTVLATDPISALDFPDFCLATGAALVERTQEGEVYRFVIRRGVSAT